MAHDRLVYMANQIGRFFAHQPEGKAVAAINDHIRKFWDPRMRRQILGHPDADGLDPRVRQAVELLRRGDAGTDGAWPGAAKEGSDG